MPTLWTSGRRIPCTEETKGKGPEMASGEEVTAYLAGRGTARPERLEQRKHEWEEKRGPDR